MTVNRRNFLLGASAAAVAAPGVAGLFLGQEGVEIDALRQDSLWTSELPAIPAQPTYTGAREVDVAIVGGGYTGLSCAYYLKKFRPDWSVVILESHKIGSGASSRNSGAVYARHVGIDDQAMAQRGLDRLLAFIDSQGIDCDLTQASTLTVLKSQGDADAARASMKDGEKWVSKEELSEKGGTSYYAGAVETSDYLKIQPAKLVAGQAKAALGSGVEIFEASPVTDIRSGKPACLTTPKGTITARNVLIATNAYTPRLGVLEDKMYPIHQYSFATRKLTTEEINGLGLDRWNLRFEPRTLPVTFSLTPSGHFFVRFVLGYASQNSGEWQDIEGARALAKKLFLQRYPSLANVEFEKSWHGVTGHTTLMKPIAGPISDEANIHVSAAYNGLGIMPSHNFGYLTACRITGTDDQDLAFLSGVTGQIHMPGDFYRSLILKPFMNLMTPV